MPPKIDNVPRPIDTAPQRAQSAPPALDRERSFYEKTGDLGWKHAGKIALTVGTAAGVAAGPLTLPIVALGLGAGAAVDYVRGRRSAPGPAVKRDREEAPQVTPPSTSKEDSVKPAEEPLRKTTRKEDSVKLAKDAVSLMTDTVKLKKTEKQKKAYLQNQLQNILGEHKQTFVNGNTLVRNEALISRMKKAVADSLPGSEELVNKIFDDLIGPSPK